MWENHSQPPSQDVFWCLGLRSSLLPVGIAQTSLALLSLNRSLLLFLFFFPTKEEKRNSSTVNGKLYKKKACYLIWDGRLFSSFLLLCWLFFVPSHPQITILPLKWRFNNYRIYMLSTLV